MSTVKTKKAAEVSTAEPVPRRWTRGEYYRMGEMGLFDGQRVELIAGEILQVTPQKNPHAVATGLAQQGLNEAFGEGFWVRNQLPLYLGEETEPEPDFAVVRGSPRDFTDHPSTALLVVEISDSTLAYDRGRKSGMYASIGIADYWIVNLLDRQLEVYRRPIREEARPFGFRYADTHIFKPGDSVTPLSASGVVRVADLLP